MEKEPFHHDGFNESEGELQGQQYARLCEAVKDHVVDHLVAQFEDLDHEAVDRYIHDVMPELRDEDVAREFFTSGTARCIYGSWSLDQWDPEKDNFIGDKPLEVYHTHGSDDSETDLEKALLSLEKVHAMLDEIRSSDGAHEIQAYYDRLDISLIRVDFLRGYLLVGIAYINELREDFLNMVLDPEDKEPALALEREKSLRHVINRYRDVNIRSDEAVDPNFVHEGEDPRLAKRRIGLEKERILKRYFDDFFDLENGKLPKSIFLNKKER